MSQVIKEKLSKLNDNEKSQHRVAFLHFCQSAVVCSYTQN